MRAAGAEAREVLIQMAAESLKLPPDSLSAKNGAVFEKKNPANKVTYGSLAKGKTIERHLDKKAPIEIAVGIRGVRQIAAARRLRGQGDRKGAVCGGHSLCLKCFTAKCCGHPSTAPS